MMGVSYTTFAFQLAWGASWAAVAFGVHFIASKYFVGKRRYGKLLMYGGLLFGAIAFALNWPYRDLDQSAQQSDARGTLFFWGALAISIPCLYYRWVLSRSFGAKERAAKAQRI